MDPTEHPVFSVSREHAVGAFHEVLISFFPSRVTVDALEAVHVASVTLRAMHPAGTTTLAVVGDGIPMPTREVRAFAAKIGREASAHLKGECIVIAGHPFWVGMARSALRAIELVARPWHPRAVFDAVEPAALWALARAGRPSSEGRDLTHAVERLVSSHALVQP